VVSGLYLRSAARSGVVPERCIHWRQRRRTGPCDRRALGVGLDLSPYYHRSRALDLSTALGNGMLRELAAMIGERGRR